MQITETLNDQQRLMYLGEKEALQNTFSIFNEMAAEGYDLEFYYINGFGGLTIVPSTKRIRVKANEAALEGPDAYNYAKLLAHKVRQSFESRLTNPKFLAGKKVSNGFKKEGHYSA